ncbi:GntR family transcriptional regulator [Nocardiopsis coralliicola]
MTTSEGLARLAEHRVDQRQQSTAEWAAAAVREQVIDGALLPGARLSEEEIGGALGVSRNTLREAFRLLKHERLVVHEFNRGVFVARPARDDVVDLYRVRRVLETPALCAPGAASPELVARIGAAVEKAEAAQSAGEWSDVGTANMYFHQTIAALHQSQRIDETVHRLLAEARLIFHAMGAPREFHVPYVPLNREIYELLHRGRTAAATERLTAYFDVAETQLLAAFDALGDG